MGGARSWDPGERARPRTYGGGRSGQDPAEQGREVVATTGQIVGVKNPPHGLLCLLCPWDAASWARGPLQGRPRVRRVPAAGRDPPNIEDPRHLRTRPSWRPCPTRGLRGPPDFSRPAPQAPQGLPPAHGVAILSCRGDSAPAGTPSPSSTSPPSLGSHLASHLLIKDSTRVCHPGFSWGVARSP